VQVVPLGRRQPRAFAEIGGIARHVADEKKQQTDDQDQEQEQGAESVVAAS